MQNVLGINDITIVKDRSKVDIIAAYEKFQRKVEHLAKTKELNQPIFVHNMWIGHLLDQDYIHKELDITSPDTCPSECDEYPKVFGLDKEGEVVTHLVYATRLSNVKDTHVVLI